MHATNDQLALVPEYLQHLDWWAKETSTGGIVLFATVEAAIVYSPSIDYSDYTTFTRIYIDGNRLTVASVGDDYASSVGFGSTDISCEYDGFVADFFGHYLRLKQFNGWSADMEILHLHHDWECPVYQIERDGWRSVGEPIEPYDDLSRLHIARQRYKGK